MIRLFFVTSYSTSVSSHPPLFTLPTEIKFTIRDSITPLIFNRVLPILHLAAKDLWKDALDKFPPPPIHKVWSYWNKQALYNSALLVVLKHTASNPVRTIILSARTEVHNPGRERLDL
ncbi:hypothetical protein BDD12DRAFT_809512 [Trichophaea hybrida]|nr:hypothetical protein BDD12DRAFT_809512 [Trichophaea hybrida]